MKSGKPWAIVLVVIGAFFLIRNLSIVPGLRFWPAMFLILGGIVLYQLLNNQGVVRSNSGTYQGGPVFGAFLIALLVLGIVGVTLFGLLTPLFLLLLPFILLAFFFRLGFGFLKLLLSLIFTAAPFLLVIWLLTLIF